MLAKETQALNKYTNNHNNGKEKGRMHMACWNNTILRSRDFQETSR